MSLKKNNLSDLENNQKNIILLGFMGSGKTSIGKLLAHDLNFNFLDLDSVIETRHGLSVNDIFKNFGESFFRDLEKKEVQNLKKLSNTIISLGGGTFCTQENINLLKASGLTVYLKAVYSTLIERYTSVEINKRPLLQDIRLVKDLLNSREIYYCQADLIIETDNLTLEEIKDNILLRIKKLK